MEAAVATAFTTAAKPAAMPAFTASPAPAQKSAFSAYGGVVHLFTPFPSSCSSRTVRPANPLVVGGKVLPSPCVPSSPSEVRFARQHGRSRVSTHLLSRIFFEDLTLRRPLRGAARGRPLPPWPMALRRRSPRALWGTPLGPLRLGTWSPLCSQPPRGF